MILKNNWESIDSLEKAAKLIEQILEALERNGVAKRESVDAMLWEFMDKQEFGYCADCDPSESGEYVHVDDARDYVCDNYDPGP